MKTNRLFLWGIVLSMGFIMSCQTTEEAQSEEPLSEVVDEEITLPPGAEEMIAQVLSEPIPDDFIPGITGYVENQGLNIWYNSINPGENHETILLINGFGGTALDVSDWLLMGLVDSGYHIIRMDYRDIGFSSWDEDWSLEKAYGFTEMISDILAVLQANQVDQFHIFGISMGGMIAQEMSIRFPERVKSVISAVSSGYIVNPDIPYEDRFGPYLERCEAQFNDPEDPANSLRLALASFEYLRGEDAREIDPEEMYWILQATRFKEAHMPESNPNAVQHQGLAVYYGGSRLETLKEVQTPYLAIHGKKDTLIYFEHALLYSASIPHCETLWVEDMGHLWTVYDSQLIMTTLLDFLELHST